MDRIFIFIERSLVALLVFMIPTNLALHFARSSANVYGINVDYLIPKLYASDLVIGALFLVVLGHHLPKIYAWVRELKLNTTSLLILLLVCSLLVSAHQSANPIASYWYLAKLGQMVVLTIYLIKCVPFDWLRLPLLTTIIFQSIVALVQWLQRSSLLGYYFLGETSLKNTSLIAKTGITGEIRPLPYGTTPHPNVLAGFLVIGSLILVYAWILTHPQLTHKVWVWIRRSLLLIPALITLALTQSLSAGLVLALGLVMLAFKQMRTVNILALMGIVIGAGLFLSGYVDELSVSRRTQLAQISQRMILAEPLLGVGPNNFTARMNDFGQVYGNHRFIQPVHNIYLLWLAEVGLINTTLLLLIGYQLYQAYSIRITYHRALAPLVGVGVIGLVDHYPLSLQTGLLISCLAIFVAWQGVQVSTSIVTSKPVLKKPRTTTVSRKKSPTKRATKKKRGKRKKKR